MIALALASLVAGTLAAAPAIETIRPAPLARGGTAEITGTGFGAGATVTIGATNQTIVLAQPTSLRFILANTTPLGPQTLTVEVAGERATSPVIVAPPAPVVTQVAPEPLVLGASAALSGTALAEVDQVTLDGTPCEIAATTATTVSFTVPFDAGLLGSASLAVSSLSGTDTVTVDIVAPLPAVATLTPNPVRAGDLLTIRGRILSLSPEVRLDGQSVTLVATESNGETLTLRVWVPTSTPSGPSQIVVRAAGIDSTPAGPLNVLPPAPRAPRVTAVYPARVAAGGGFWVIGTDLGAIDGAIGVDLTACDAHACRLETGATPPGPPFQVAITGPDGAAAFPVEIIAAAATEPIVTATTPSPARRGEPLTLTITNAAAVRTVVLGGVPQLITFFDEDEVVVTVDAATPLGVETLFVASNVGSDGVSVTVLDPAPVDPDPGPEPVAERGPDGVEARPKHHDDGCAAGAVASSLLPALLLLFGIAIRFRQ